tara:strand:+ start:1000 stop:2337 length:1338 start_codon:yes stop_codon:yes gene_type:complete
MNNKKSKVRTIKYLKKDKNKNKNPVNILNDSLKNSNKKYNILNDSLEKSNKNDINPEDFIKIIPLNTNKATKMEDPFNKVSDIFDLLLNKTKQKNIDFIPLKEYHLDLNLSYYENDSKINDLDKLIYFAKNLNNENNYCFDIKKLECLIKPLEELNNFIGMNDIKNNIIKQIIYFLQDLDREANIMHTVITGLPGLGKTKLAYLLSEIYFKMNVFMFKNEERKYISPITNQEIDYKFTIARRSDLIGEYVGHTAVKTQNLINKALGGVLFIDEAYSLGNDKKDSFSKECIDTLNQNLTENKGKFLVIIAGYEEDLEENFFKFNKGLKRRFPFKYKIEPYTFEELGLIFLSKIKEDKWILDDKLELIEGNKLFNFFKSKYNDFKCYGGDMELLLLSTKIAHSLRIFCKNPNLRKRIDYEDIEEGFNIFKEAKNNNDNSKGYNGMYI